ncbi:Hypothetical predicted protein, partial [Pelobates cultripes]
MEDRHFGVLDWLIVYIINPLLIGFLIQYGIFIFTRIIKPPQRLYRFQVARVTGLASVSGSHGNGR